ncbi:MAG: shikimate kinase [Lentisphaeraceae bacterium]|nr:shikimate kinase [Lentisphaeraceae bacterium]
MTNIILIGFMSCGKSSVGRHLAKESGMNLYDLDSMIVERAGMTIPDIFEDVGEKAFRDLESYVTSLIHQYDGSIFATGGGVILREKNRDILKKSGMVIWLKTTAENVLKYTNRDTNRPLLEGKKSLEKIQSMMNQREEIYADCAHYSINAWENNLNQIAEKIWAFYEDYQNKQHSQITI